MALTTCKKCNKIYTAGATDCPYCGAVTTQNLSGSVNFKLIRIAGVLLFILASILTFNSLRNVGTRQDSLSALSSGDIRRQSCVLTACDAGAKAITLATQPYYTCKSGELSDYANFVLSVTLDQIRLKGYATPISDITGEPEVSGNDRISLDRYRARAGVASFEAALAQCYKGTGAVRVVVLYNMKDGNSIYVSDQKNPEDKFWLPKAELDKL